MIKSLEALPLTAKTNYKIIKKGAGIVDMHMTMIQMRIIYVWRKLLEQEKRANLVIVKPRQIMATTAFNAAEFKLSYDIPGLQTLLLSHRAAVTDEVFGNLKRFQDQMPEEARLGEKKNNERKLELSNLSAITCGVAGTDSARGFPCLILQLTELGRMKDRHVKDIQEGAMNAHADAELGASLLVDSTSGGQGNYFHEVATLGWPYSKQKAVSSWFTIFFGWNEMPQYRLPPPKGFAPEAEEEKLMRDYNLDIQQIYWRHYKLHQKMRGDITAFMREYPLTFEEAFSSAEGRLIDAVCLYNALEAQTQPDKSQPLVIGVDPAGDGDRTAIVIRQGYTILKHYVFNRMDAWTLTNICIKMMDQWKADHLFIDMGYGHGTYNNLKGQGRRNVTGVHFGGSAANKKLYFNKRAEMAADFQDWMEEGPDGTGGLANIPDDKEFIRDINMIPKLAYDSGERVFKLPSKAEIKAELGKSPDIFDATILTFAYPVRTQRMINDTQEAYSQAQTSSLLTTQKTFDSLQDGDGQATMNPNYRYYSFGRTTKPYGYNNPTSGFPDQY